MIIRARPAFGMPKPPAGGGGPSPGPARFAQGPANGGGVAKQAARVERLIGDLLYIVRTCTYAYGGTQRSYHDQYNVMYNDVDWSICRQ